jgi:hypothetical protein
MLRLRFIAGILLAALLPQAAARAQGAPSGAAALPLGVDSLDLYLVQGSAATRVGMVWDELQRVERDGAPVLRRVYRTENAAFGPTLDSTYSRWADLGPISHRAIGRIVSEQVRYRPDSIVGQRTVGGGPVTPITRAWAGELSDGATFDLLIRAAPLTEGYALAIPSFVASTDTVARLTARVVGTERFTPSSGTTAVDAWKVEMDFCGRVEGGDGLRRTCEHAVDREADAPPGSTNHSAHAAADDAHGTSGGGPSGRLNVRDRERLNSNASQRLTSAPCVGGTTRGSNGACFRRNAGKWCRRRP